MSAAYDLDVSAAGSVYIVGPASDEGYNSARLVKLRGDRKLLWKAFLGGNFADDVAVSGDFVYVGSAIDFPEPLLQYLTKFRSKGSRVWQRSTESDRLVSGLSADAEGNVYLTSDFFVDSEVQYDDYFVSKYTSSGKVAFDKAFRNSATNARVSDIGVASSGELYLVGSTDGKVNGKKNGNRDAFLLRLNGQGSKIWER